jgi:hypothetical protein
VGLRNGHVRSLADLVDMKLALKTARPERPWLAAGGQ